eukprot:g244.t1
MDDYNPFSKLVMQYARSTHPHVSEDNLTRIDESMKPRSGSKMSEEQALSLFTMKSLHSALNFLKSDSALKENGIFRIPASVSEVTACYKAIVDRGEDINRMQRPFSAHAVAGAIKRVLRDHKPLIPYRAYTAIVDAATAVNVLPKVSAVSGLGSLIGRLLPEPNQMLLFDLLKLCVAIDKEKCNEMTSESLSIVLSPNVLRKRVTKSLNNITGRNVQDLLYEGRMDAKEATEAFLVLIENADDIISPSSLQNIENIQTKKIKNPESSNPLNSPLHTIKKSRYSSEKASWMGAADCAICNTKFSVFNRRHHCRLCGNSVCDPCSKSSILLPQRLCAKDKGRITSPGKKVPENEEAVEEQERVCNVCCRQLLTQEERIMEIKRKADAAIKLKKEELISTKRTVRQMESDCNSLRSILTEREEQLSASIRLQKGKEKELNEMKRQLQDAKYREIRFSSRLAEQQSTLREALKLLRPHDRRDILQKLREERDPSIEEEWSSPPNQRSIVDNEMQNILNEGVDGFESRGGRRRYNARKNAETNTVCTGGCVLS